LANYSLLNSAYYSYLVINDLFIFDKQRVAKLDDSRLLRDQYMCLPKSEVLMIYGDKHGVHNRRHYYIIEINKEYQKSRDYYITEINKEYQNPEIITLLR
jgi:hypothetical protein